MVDKADCERAAMELRAFAMELERDGYQPAVICDAMMTVGMTAAKQMGGARHLAGYLEEMAHHYQAEANGSEGAEGATTH